jgi:hypothetical protein
MPTLLPQVLSGLVVIPTIDLSSGLYKVSIAVNTGQSRAGSPPPQVVTREDLVVEVKNSTDGSFEPVASPDPGPLPVRALRVVQARGDFTFSQGADPAQEVTVALRNDRKSFPVGKTLTPVSCLGREPKEGGPFPPGKRRPIFGLIPSLVRRTRCRVRRFDAPLNVVPDPSVKSEHFDVEADFAAAGKKFQCRCCEYRQFVRGTFTDAGGAGVPFDMPSGPLDPTRWCEDGSIDEFGSGSHGYYGHRQTSSAGDEYGGSGPSQGCAYRGNETASCPPAESAHLEYLGLIVDGCQRTVVATRSWTVDL